MILCLTKNVSSNYFITRVRITCCFSTATSTRTKTVSFGDWYATITLWPYVCGAPWNRTTMIPASTGCSRTISAKAPGSLYEDRTHVSDSKDRRPNH